MRTPNKQPQRQQLEQLVADYVRNGGTVHRDNRFVLLACPSCGHRKQVRAWNGRRITSGTCRCGGRMVVD